MLTRSSKFEVQSSKGPRGFFALRSLNFELRRTASHDCGQAIKSAWWMPRRREAMKDVVGCDMPRGAVKQALIRGSPNRETGRHWATRWRHLRRKSYSPWGYPRGQKH